MSTYALITTPILSNRAGLIDDHLRRVEKHRSLHQPHRSSTWFCLTSSLQSRNAFAHTLIAVNSPGEGDAFHIRERDQMCWYKIGCSVSPRCPYRMTCYAQGRTRKAPKIFCQKRKRENLSPAHSEHMGPSNRKHSQYTYSRMVYSTYYGNMPFSPTTIHKNPTTKTQCSLECIKKTKEQTFFNTASTRKCVYTPFSRGSFTEGRIAIYRRPVHTYPSWYLYSRLPMEGVWYRDIHIELATVFLWYFCYW